MILPFRAEPELDYCRDGGSIDIRFTDFWGRKFLMELPIKMGGTSKEDMKPIGYRSPKLTKYKEIKKKSKISGKSYSTTVEVDIKLSQKKSLALADKILKSVSAATAKEIAGVLVFALENNGKLKDS